MNTSEGRWETGKGTGEARGLQENLGVAPRDDECESGGDNSELQRGIEKRRGRREREREISVRGNGYSLAAGTGPVLREWVEGAMKIKRKRGKKKKRKGAKRVETRGITEHAGAQR